MSVFVLDSQGLGNVITSLPLLARLVDRLGARDVTVVARGPAADLVRAAGVTEVLRWAGPLAALRAAHAARGRGASRLVAVPPLSPGKARAFAALSRLRFVEPARPITLHAHTHVSAAMQALADALDLGPLPRPALPVDWREGPLPEARRAEARRWEAAAIRIAVHLGSEPANDHKRWSVTRFRDALAQACHGLEDVAVALVGTETHLAAALADAAPDRLRDALLDFTGVLSLRESARVVARADAMLSSDSGLMHLAAALGVPAFAVFGPTSETCWFPAGAAGRAFAARRCLGPCYPAVPRACRTARCVDDVDAATVGDALGSYVRVHRGAGAAA